MRRLNVCRVLLPDDDAAVLTRAILETVKAFRRHFHFLCRLKRVNAIPMRL
ncbi:hypothetical protein [Neisseria viridiae]|uniref:hypothetical protein n=1 Tax=Neisseria viridiae TaxID=2830648 RepID=UPI00272DC0E7|nr:hypothetical protein [Neisseria viridiae]